MKTQTYHITIDAPASKVYQTMLNRDTYRQWTAPFHPGSDYEGGWNKGDKISFFGPTENGERQGMLAEVIENIPNTFVSLRHYGFVSGDQEITDGPHVSEWAGALENYSFEETDGKTNLRIDVDTNEEHIDHFNDSWPKALEKLKALSE